MAESTIATLPERLQAEIEKAALAQDRPLGDVLADAVTAYLDERSWRKLIDSGRERAKSLGLTEEDVPRLIAESRSEQGHRR